MPTSSAAPAEHPKPLKETEAGNYFVSNYPPYSFWKPEFVPEVARILDSAPRPEIPLGVYFHIPFCRKRCHFCYFRVYTDKSSDEIASYLDTLVREADLYSQTPAYAERPLNFVYFGGGTPSFLSSQQLENLVGRLTRLMTWKDAEEKLEYEQARQCEKPDHEDCAKHSRVLQTRTVYCTREPRTGFRLLS